MFKIGDKIVYNDDSRRGVVEGPFHISEDKLEIGKIYNVISSGGQFVVLEEYPFAGICSDRFVPLMEHRIKKINKICSKLEI